MPREIKKDLLDIRMRLSRLELDHKLDKLKDPRDRLRVIVTHDLDLEREILGLNESPELLKRGTE